MDAKVSNADAAVTAVSVGELVRRRLGQSDDPWELALVQRSLTWDEVRMARLLDSLLAGYPIGALLVCRVRHGGSVIVDTSDGREARQADDSVHQLLDGQQRVNALVSLFSGASEFGRFFIDMTAERKAGEIVQRRRDKRTTVRYIKWSADGEFSDQPKEGERERFLALSRFADWASPKSDAELRSLHAELESNNELAMATLSGIDPECRPADDPGALVVAAKRTTRLIELWVSPSIPVQHLVLDEPADVLQVFTRINLEGVRIAGDDVFFAGVKTRWPGAEQAVHQVQKRLPLVGRMSALRLIARLANVKVGSGDMLPLRVESLNGPAGEKLIGALGRLTTEGHDLDRMENVSRALIDTSGLGYALRYVDGRLFDHVLGWAAVNAHADDPSWVAGQLEPLSTYLLGATAYRWGSILRDTFDRIAFRESLAAGSLGESFPTDRIIAAVRRRWPEMKSGRRSVEPGAVKVSDNARLFLSVLQELPFEPPEGREVEWDHIYPQAKADRMRWRGRDETERLQAHPDRRRVWHGANLWALDGAINLAASDAWPSDKFEMLESLPDPERRLPTVWPVEGFLDQRERHYLLEADRALRNGEVADGMNHFTLYMKARRSHISDSMTDRFPGIAAFAADYGLDPYGLSERELPPALVDAQNVLVSPDHSTSPENDVLSTDEIRSIAYEYLRQRDPERSTGEHYYEVLHAVEDYGRAAKGDGAPRVHGVLSNAPSLFASLGSGRFTWCELATSGRRYWVLRTDRNNRPALWAELAQGRLRQGWGWSDDQDLRAIRRQREQGIELSDAQRQALRNRRMLSDEPNSIQLDDLIIVPHMPAEGRYTVARLVEPYLYEPPPGWDDYRHILGVEMVTPSGGVDRNDPRISRSLRRSLRNQNRMWNIDPVGPDVELLLQTVASPNPAKQDR